MLSAISKFTGLLKATHYPDWIPAVAVKDFRRIASSWQFSLCYLLPTFLIWLPAVQTQTDAFSSGALVILYIYLIIATIFVIPQLARSSTRNDLNNKNSLDILILTNISPWEYILSKWLLHAATAGLFLAAIAPFMLVAQYYSHSNVACMIINLLIIMMASALTISYAICTSRMGLGIRMFTGLPFYIALYSFVGTTFFIENKLDSLHTWLVLSAFAVNSIFFSLLMSMISCVQLRPSAARFNKRLYKIVALYYILTLLPLTAGIVWEQGNYTTAGVIQIILFFIFAFMAASTRIFKQ